MIIISKATRPYLNVVLIVIGLRIIALSRNWNRVEMFELLEESKTLPILFLPMSIKAIPVLFANVHKDVTHFISANVLNSSVHRTRHCSDCPFVHLHITFPLFIYFIFAEFCTFS